MSLAFAGFPVTTFKVVGDTTMLVLATIRAECDRAGRCHKDQRFLATKAGIALGTFNYHLAKLRRRGVVAMIYRGKRRSAVIVILPEHRWATPEKPAPRASECSKVSNTSSKASFKEGPVAPADAGDAPPVFEKQQEEGEPAPQQPSPFGPCERCGAVRTAPAPAPCRHCGSTRRTPYSQPRQPRAPRPRRQQEVKARLMEAFRIAGAAREIPAARLAVPPPAIEIIPLNEIIPFPRAAGPRGCSTPTMRMMEAFYYAGRKPDPEDRDIGNYREAAHSFPSAGRTPLGVQSACR